MVLIIILGFLLAIALFSLMVNSMNHLYFTEKEVEVIDYIFIPRDKYQNGGYHPVVKFEIDGKAYWGELRVYPTWPSKHQRSVIILYNPRNPGEFVAKETSKSPVTGCFFVVALAIALVIAIFYHFQNH